MKLLYLMKQNKLKKIYLIENEIAYAKGIKRWFYEKWLERVVNNE